MTVDRWSNIHAKLNAMIEVMRNQNERLARIEADLSEIKARLAHASPGYDMDKSGSLEEYEGLADAWRAAGEQEEGR